jgi:hypothetical protein
MGWMFGTSFLVGGDFSLCRQVQTGSVTNQTATQWILLMNEYVL